MAKPKQYPQEPDCYIYTLVRARVARHEEIDLGYLRCLICDKHGNYKIGNVEKRCLAPPQEMNRKSGKDLVALVL